MASTPLHDAVASDDRELAEVVLAAHPDLTLTDAVYNSTALGWARALDRPEIERMIVARSGDELP